MTDKPQKIWLLYDHRGGNLNGYKLCVAQRDPDSQPLADFMEIVGEYELLPALDEIGIWADSEERGNACWQCIEFGSDPMCHCHYTRNGS